MAKLRASMGEDAYILNTERSKNGQIIIRAAVEQPRESEIEPDPESLMAAEPPPVTVNAALQHDCAVQKISDAMAFHRAPENIVAPLKQTIDAVACADAVLTLAAALDARFGFAPLVCSPARPILLIGPAGAGKTLTAAKLAARSLLEGNDAMLISTDMVRAGGSEQLAAYARIMERPLHIAASSAALQEILASRPPDAACIIDTAGVSPFNLDEMLALKSLIAVSGAEPVLVLNAGGDAAEACEIAGLFAGLGARGLIVTRLDTTRRLGSILSALEAGAMTLRHVSITPYVAQGLAPITPVTLARLLLEDPFDHPSFKELEQASQ